MYLLIGCNIEPILMDVDIDIINKYGIKFFPYDFYSFLKG